MTRDRSIERDSLHARDAAPRGRERRWTPVDLLAGLFGVLFLASAVAQYNDPDPLAWVVVYAAAGVACLTHRARGSWLLAAAVGAAALLWSAVLAPQALPGLRLADLAREMKADRPSVELGREFLGLLIIAASMIALVFRSRRARSGSAT